MTTYKASDGRSVMGIQRARRYQDSLKDKSPGSNATGGKPANPGGKSIERDISRDESEGETHGLPKVSTSDPDAKEKDTPDELTAPANTQSDGMDNAPGGPAWESDFKQHGMAHDIHITHDSTGSHLTAKHQDGFVHESHHLNAAQAHDAGRFLGGVTPDMEPQETPNSRARDYPVGPKEDTRMKRENKGMGIHVGDGDKIPGLA